MVFAPSSANLADYKDQRSKGGPTSSKGKKKHRETKMHMQVEEVKTKSGGGPGQAQSPTSVVVELSTQPAPTKSLSERMALVAKRNDELVKKVSTSYARFSPFRGLTSANMRERTTELQLPPIGQELALWNRKEWFRPRNVHKYAELRRRTRQQLSWAVDSAMRFNLNDLTRPAAGPFFPARNKEGTEYYCSKFEKEKVAGDGSGDNNMNPRVLEQHDRGGTTRQEMNSTPASNPLHTRVDGEDRLMTRKSMVRLRGLGLPNFAKTGKFLNFGCGTCDAEDPLHWLFPANYRNNKGMENFSSLAEENVGIASMAEPQNQIKSEKSSNGPRGLKRLQGGPTLEQENADRILEARSALQWITEPRPLSGFGFELDVDDARTCSQHLGDDSIKIFTGGVTPENIHEKLDDTGYFPPVLIEDKNLEEKMTHGTGRSVAEDKVVVKELSNKERQRQINTETRYIEFVKIDIDSWEYQILEAVEDRARASGVTVLVYIIEIQGQFPPPIRYYAKHTPGEGVVRRKIQRQKESAERDYEKARSSTSSATSSPGPTSTSQEHEAQRKDHVGSRVLKNVDNSFKAVGSPTSLQEEQAVTTSALALTQLAANNMDKHHRLTRRSRHPHYIGTSLQAVVDYLRPTHSLMMLRGMDAIFVENSIVVPQIQKEYQIRLPFDEEACFEVHEAWHAWREEYISDWIYGDDAWENRVPRIASNMTMCDPHWENPSNETWPEGVRAPDFEVGI
ncbi:unnamed protein product [Amoebophrya sp. A25]|nr:unnamed protein product [Amoebophrya sp. A25]|eukprot:GSA25T00000168001.1